MTRNVQFSKYGQSIWTNALIVQFTRNWKFATKMKAEPELETVRCATDSSPGPWGWPVGTWGWRDPRPASWLLHHRPPRHLRTRAPRELLPSPQPWFIPPRSEVKLKQRTQRITNRSWSEIDYKVLPWVTKIDDVIKWARYLVQSINLTAMQCQVATI